MKSRKVYYTVLSILIVIIGTGPLLVYAVRPDTPWLNPQALCALNLLAWSAILLLVVSKQLLRETVAKRARQLGIDPTLKSLDTMLEELLFELKRKNESLSINLVQGKVSSREELTTALEKIVSRAYELLQASSAELALFDESSRLYHSAFLIGNPFQASAQAMLSESLKSERRLNSPDVMVQPVAFAGTVLGTLRVALKDSKIPTEADREIVKLLALQAGLALMNAEYSNQLLKMNKSSEESTKARTGFLANLSHEIRGPLGIMLNAVELILDGICGSVSEEQVRTLGMIQSNGKHLLELINDVLDYSKVESGRLFPKKIEILLDGILKDITTIVRSQAIEKSHKLVYRPPEKPLAIMCDKRHLRQMLINLLTNAVKYTPEGGNIEVWAERIPGNRVKISVQDTGVGIDAQDRAKVFSAFERIEHNYSMTQVGTGLGMPLTKRLAEVNGGQIDFRSSPGKGSHFWLTFPAIKPPEASATEEKEEKIVVDGKGDLILLVERDEGERNMLSRYLSHSGFKVVCAESKLAAIDVLHEQAVAVVVLDNNVTDDPDESLVETIRKNTPVSSLPIVLLSSRAFVADIKHYLREGVDRCLVKPVELQYLAEICRNLIDGSYTDQVVDKDGERNKKDSTKFPLLKPRDPSEVAH